MSNMERIAMYDAMFTNCKFRMIVARDSGESLTFWRYAAISNRILMAKINLIK